MSGLPQNFYNQDQNGNDNNNNQHQHKQFNNNNPFFEDVTDQRIRNLPMIGNNDNENEQEV